MLPPVVRARKRTIFWLRLSGDRHYLRCLSRLLDLIPARARRLSHVGVLAPSLERRFVEVRSNLTRRKDGALLRLQTIYSGSMPLHMLPPTLLRDCAL